MKRSLSVKESIDDYETEVNYEINKKNPDVYFLRILSNKLLERAECTDNLLERSTVYASVITNLDRAIDYGAGYKNEDEFTLIEVMNIYRDLMLDAIEEQHKDLAPEELGKVSDYLKTESESYSSIDSENRLQTSFKKVVSLRKESIGIT